MKIFIVYESRYNELSLLLKHKAYSSKVMGG